jgi:hypothetical protein
MRQVLKQLTTQYARLRSLDLTSWDNLSENVLRELPPTLLSLNLSYTTIASAPGTKNSQQAKQSETRT